MRRGTTRVRELMAAGVPVAFGQDCVKDGFYPYGRGDMLEVALVSAHAAHLATVDEQHLALAAVTTVPAAAWRLGTTYGVQVGARADLQLYAASSWPEVLRLQDPPRQVWFRGRTVARTTVTREPSADPDRSDVLHHAEPARSGGNDHVRVIISGWGGRVAQARLTAETTALSEAVTMLGSMPTPQRIRSPIAHSTYAAARASPPEDSACSA